jgi:hypothetical protein
MILDLLSWFHLQLLARLFVMQEWLLFLSARARFCQNEQSGKEDWAHSFPKKGGMDALNDLAVNCRPYINQLVAKDQKVEGSECSLKETIENLKDLSERPRL